MKSPIKAYIDSRRMTAAAFADLVGVKKAAVSKWMRGRGPSIESAKLIEERTQGDLPKEILRPDVWSDDRPFPVAGGRAKTEAAA